MKPLFRADLHCHSTCSDGTYSVEELLKHAVASGLSGLSITDHDTIDAYARAIPLAAELKLPLISGVEFSTTLLGESIHILGYAFDIKNASIQHLCKRHQSRREDRNNKILHLLKKHNISIEIEDIMSQDLKEGTIGRPHIAMAMVRKGYVESVEQAFKRYLAEGKPCYAPSQEITVEETIEVIKESKGLVVIAHPHLIKSHKALKRLLQMPFDGIECYYAIFPSEKAEPWVAIAAEKGWLVTGGSDFHGQIKPKISLGSSWTPEETFQQLYNHYKSAND